MRNCGATFCLYSTRSPGTSTELLRALVTSCAFEGRPPGVPEPAWHASVNAHASAEYGLCRRGARFEEACRPQPLVDAHPFHRLVNDGRCCVGRARRRADTAR